VQPIAAQQADDVRWTAIVAIGALLALFRLALPVSLPESSADGGREECFTLPDATATAAPTVVARLERCTALYPTDVELMAGLGAAYEAAGDTARAERIDGRVLAMAPDYADVRVRLARLLLRRGDVAGARREAHEALRVQPNRQSVLDLIAGTGEARAGDAR
jgi:Flp pilus assembly protein TadD